MMVNISLLDVGMDRHTFIAYGQENGPSKFLDTWITTPGIVVDTATQLPQKFD